MGGLWELSRETDLRDVFYSLRKKAKLSLPEKAKHTPGLWLRIHHGIGLNHSNNVEMSPVQASYLEQKISTFFEWTKVTRISPDKKKSKMESPFDLL